MDDKRYSYYFHPYELDMEKSVDIHGFFVKPNHYVNVDLIKDPITNIIKAKISVNLPPGNSVNVKDLPTIVAGGEVYTFEESDEGDQFTIIEIRSVINLSLKSGNDPIGRITIDPRPGAGVPVSFLFNVGTPVNK